MESPASLVQANFRASSSGLVSERINSRFVRLLSENIRREEALFSDANAYPDFIGHGRHAEIIGMSPNIVYCKIFRANFGSKSPASTRSTRSTIFSADATPSTKSTNLPS